MATASRRHQRFTVFVLHINNNHVRSSFGKTPAPTESAGLMFPLAGRLLGSAGDWENPRVRHRAKRTDTAVDAPVLLRIVWLVHTKS